MARNASSGETVVSKPVIETSRDMEEGDIFIGERMQHEYYTLLEKDREHINQGDFFDCSDTYT